MSEDYGNWTDWLLCLGVANTLLVGCVVYRLLEKIRTLSTALSPLRKAFGVLSLIAIPYMVTVGFGEQAASPMNPHSPILWFTAAAVYAVVFFWVCEELITTKPFLRSIFLVILGMLVILALHHQVKWAMAAADDIAKKSEMEEARTCKNEVMALRDRAKLYSALTEASAKPPEATNCPPGILKPKPKPHEKTQLPLPETPVQLSATFYDPQAPAIVVFNPSDHVVENVIFEMVLFRTSDLVFFSFSTQALGYVKPQTSSASYAMPKAPAFSEGNAQLADGDELTGSVSVDCPQCEIQTYIVHFVWGHTGWFFESPKKGGYIVPKNMSTDGRAKYIQLFTGGTFAKDRIEFKPRPPL